MQNLTTGEAFFNHIMSQEEISLRQQTCPVWYIKLPDDKLQVLLDGDGVYWALRFDSTNAILVDEVYNASEALDNLWVKLAYKTRRVA